MTLCTLARMWVAFGFSTGFALLTGYAAAYMPRARAVILPTIDVLQSVPISGYLFAAIGLLSGFFPESRWGFELASVLAIFTSQVWNLCLSVYQSLSSLPRDLLEASAVSAMGRWKRIYLLELPWASRSLIWNAMLSFGAGWFFVIQSESLSMGRASMELPGLGSYLGACLENADTRGVLLATLAMLLCILLTDRLVWHPLLVWSERFTPDGGSANLPSRFTAPEMRPPTTQPPAAVSRAIKNTLPPPGSASRHRPLQLLALGVALATAAALAGKPAWSNTVDADCASGKTLPFLESFPLREFLDLPRLGARTFARVAATTLLASLIWVPAGIFLGSHPTTFRIAQPAAQIAAAFPANLAFPLLAGVLAQHPRFADLGSGLMMFLAAQWYILFNVNATAASIPSNLSEVTRCFGMSGLDRWKTLLLPAVFPGWVTGACTAAGAAWNASVVAEVTSWGTATLQTQGIGSYIANAAKSADGPRLFAGICVMSALVLATNRLLWRPLYELAAARFHTDD